MQILSRAKYLYILSSRYNRMQNVGRNARLSLIVILRMKSDRHKRIKSDQILNGFNSVQVLKAGYKKRTWVEVHMVPGSPLQASMECPVRSIVHQLSLTLQNLCSGAGAGAGYGPGLRDGLTAPSYERHSVFSTN